MIKLDIDEVTNKIERIDHQGHRFYTKNGKDPLPSVTSLLSTPEKEAGLNAWRKRTPDWRWINKKALERGTAVHESIEHYLWTNGSVQIESKYADLMPPLFKVMEQLVDTVHGIETMLHNKEIGAAGTADLICKLKDGRTVVGDYKTSEKKKDVKWMKDYFIQILTYAKMYEIEMGRPIDAVMILNVYEKPKPDCHPIIVDITEEAQNKVLRFIKNQSDELM